MAQAQSYATAAALTAARLRRQRHQRGHAGLRDRARLAGCQDPAGGPGHHRGRRHADAHRVRARPTRCRLDAGTTVTLSVEESSISDVGHFVAGPTVHKSVRWPRRPRACRHRVWRAAPPTAYLGIDPQDQQDWDFPVKVTVHTQDIGGPSAGLAMTLGIIDKLSSGRLTGHRIVAATGTIDPEGNVGDVGGVAEKTIAVERAGATVFFVPSVELEAAESKATPQLHVYAVDNLGPGPAHPRAPGRQRAGEPPVPAQAAP